MEPLILPLMMYKETGSVKKGTKKCMWVVPSWNHLYTIARGRVFLDQWAQKHKEVIIENIDYWVRNNDWTMLKEQKLIANCTVYLPSAKTIDLHNLDKLILDCMQGRIIEDDSYILLRYIDFDLDIEHPRIEFTFDIGEKFNRKERKKELMKAKKGKEKTLPI